jgi:phosphate transport system permease protein
VKRFRKQIEKIFEGIFFASSTVTTITIIFIIFFLFKEGLGIFNSSPLEPHYVIAVNQGNPVKNLTSKQLKDVFNQQITNWKLLDGNNDSIIRFTIDEIGNYYTEEQLGSNFENLPKYINEYISSHSGVIACFLESNIPKNFKGKIIHVNKVSLKEFVLGREWYPTAAPVAQFGTLPLILGTLWVSIGAILLALPIGLVTAIYLAEVAGSGFRSFLKPVIELLAGIPSVVYGFFGLVVLVPLIQKTFNLAVGETALAGSIILAIMALPTIITISEDAIRTTPQSLKEASLALGATRWQTLVRVIIPYSKSGITAAVILGIGRAVGETMAVLMVTGNAAIMPTSFLQPVRTIPATIAAELGEASFGGVHFKALFALGIILFIITFGFNLMVDLTRSKNVGNNQST